MKYTEKLNLPIYDTPETDLFKIQDWNEANKALDGAYEDILNFREELPKVNANAEIIEAREGAVTLGENIKRISSSLEQVENGMYLSDNTVGNNIPSLAVYSLEFLQNQQIKLLAEFYRNLLKGVLQTICCQGDSLTYGLDRVSTDKRPSIDGNENNTRASITYPEALQNQLNNVFGSNKVNVITRGISGGSVKSGYEAWTTPSNANLTLFQYGTNDSRASWVDYKGNVTKYIEWYEKIITREILRGSAVVIISPPRDRENDRDIYTFSNALEKLANKYSCPFVRGDELLLNYSSDVFSDEVHFNGVGYTIHASRITSAILNRFIKNNIVNGSKIGVYPNQDNIYLGEGARYAENAQYPTPSQKDVTMGSAIFFNNSTQNGKITIPFYTAQDDLIVYPNVFINDNSSVIVELDFNVKQAQFSNYQLVGKSNRTQANSSITISTTTAKFNNRLTNANDFIHIPKKGWHTITLSTNATSIIGYYGLEFLDYNSKEILTKISNIYSITTFKNNWINYGSPNGESPLVCSKNLEGMIHLRGYVKGGTDKQICTLPSECIPKNTIIIPCYVYYTFTNEEKVCFVEITVNGGVYFIGDLTNINRVAINAFIK